MTRALLLVNMATNVTGALVKKLSCCVVIGRDNSTSYVTGHLTACCVLNVFSWTHWMVHRCESQIDFYISGNYVFPLDG